MMAKPSPLLTFTDRYRDEAACIQALADLRWPAGFACEQCGGTKACRLVSRPRVFECLGCGHQRSVTAGTIFHKTRTALRKWFLAAYLMMRDKRGVSALQLSRELNLRYDTAWLIAHKLRHALSENAETRLRALVEVDETFLQGKGRPPGRGLRKAEDRSLVVAVVEKRVAAEPRNKGIRGQGFVAGSVRIAVLANTTAAALGGFIRSQVEPGAKIVTDGLGPSGTSPDCRHAPVVGPARPKVMRLPVVRTLFANLKAWLTGTHHGVSSKHLPRYLREWSYRFNRRGLIGKLDHFILRRAVRKPTITYKQLVAGMAPQSG